MSISEDWERARAGRTFRLGCNHSKVIRGKNHRPSPMTVVLGEKEMALNTRRSRTSSSNHQCIWHHDLFKWPNGSPDRQPLWRVHFSMSLSAAYTSTRSNPLEPTLCFSSKIVGSCLHPLSMPSWQSGRATSMNGYHTFSRTFTFYRSWRLLLRVLSRTFRNSCRNICWL